jgi:hypothetical protein
MRIIGAPTPAKERKLRLLGEFAGADTVTYEDKGNGEVYVLTKGDQRITLTVSGNKYDGGFLSIDTPDTVPFKRPGSLVFERCPTCKHLLAESGRACCEGDCDCQCNVTGASRAF